MIQKEDLKKKVVSQKKTKMTEGMRGLRRKKSPFQPLTDSFVVSVFWDVFQYEAVPFLSNVDFVFL